LLAFGHQGLLLYHVEVLDDAGVQLEIELDAFFRVLSNLDLLFEPLTQYIPHPLHA